MKSPSSTPKIIPLPTSSPPADKEKTERYTRRTDGRYQLEKRYTLPDGTQKKKSFYGKTQAEANAKRRAFERSLEDGINTSMLNVKLEAYAETWLRVHKANVEKNTFKTYRHDVDLLIEQCGKKKVREITLTDVQAVLNGRAGLSKSAVKKTAMTMRAIFEAARADRIISFNPCDKLVMPEAEDGTHRVLTKEEIDLITNACQDHRFHLAAMLMLYAGLRRGEVMAFDLSRDVDLKANTIQVIQSVHHEGNKAVLGPPKSKASVRTIPIMPPLLPLLEANVGKGLALPDAKGNHMSSSGFKRIFESYCYNLEVVMNGVRKRWADEKQIANWKSCTFLCHDLRHTFCSMLYDAGVDVKTAQLWMGHADIMVTMRIYTHLSNQKQDKATKAATKHFKKYVGQNVGQTKKVSQKIVDK